MRTCTDSHQFGDITIVIQFSIEALGNYLNCKGVVFSQRSSRRGARLDLGRFEFGAGTGARMRGGTGAGAGAWAWVGAGAWAGAGAQGE